LAFVTFAITMSIKCALLPCSSLIHISSTSSLRYFKVLNWTLNSTRTIIENNPKGIFDGTDPQFYHPIVLDDLPLLNDNGQEILIYNSASDCIPYKHPTLGQSMPPCGILVDLSNIQALFNSYTFYHDDSKSDSDLEDSHFVHIDAYPLTFLRTVRNIQADGIPSCFYPLLTNINDFVKKHIPLDQSHSHNHHHSRDDDDEDVSSINMDDSDHHDIPFYLQAIKPIFAQFYNYIMHRVATHAGKHNSQQGMITVTISGAFANTQKHKTIASKKQSHYD